MKERMSVRGFLRIQLGEEKDGKQVVVKDSGWCENTVTNDGLNNYIAGTVGAVTGSKQVNYLLLGSQTNAINATQQNISGPHSDAQSGGFKAIDHSTVATQTGWFQATASWASSNDNNKTQGISIGGLGLYNTNSTTAQMCAGQTFAQGASNWASNQNVSATYQLRFS